MVQSQCLFETEGGSLQKQCERQVSAHSSRLPPEAAREICVRMPARYVRSLAGLSLACQRSLSEELGHVLPRAQQQARAFHISLRDERGFAQRLAARGRDHLSDHRALGHRRLQARLELHDIEREVKDLSEQDRLTIRRSRSKPLLLEFKAWLLVDRPRLVKADVTARAMDYTLRRWDALLVHLDDARVPVDNNAVENVIRPIALGRKNWLFIGSEQAGERAAVLMSLIESAKLNGHDAWAYIKDVLTKLPTWPNSRIEELLPYRWVTPAIT